MGSQSIITAMEPFSREFDALLPSDHLSVRPAKLRELPTLARIARRAIPGVRLSGSKLKAFCVRDRDTVFSFSRSTHLVGGVAFLYLNSLGFDALILDEINLAEPEVKFLATANERPEAIYLWAISGAGLSALGHITSRFAKERYRYADIYTRPVTPEGELLMRRMGFESTSAWREGLWRYQRLTNRADRSPSMQNAA